MRETVRLIGLGIVSSSTYLPIRNLAAAWASKAPAKNYLEQARRVFDGFLSRWRYVRDPVSRELVTYSPDAVYRLMLAGDGVGVGAGKGAGDCDCATVALGALYSSIGFPVRIATIAKPGSPPSPLMDHVFPEIQIPGLGWITTDPVLWPKAGFGAHPPAIRKTIYDLDGRVLSSTGNLGGVEMQQPYNWQAYQQQYNAGLPPIEQYRDYSGMLGAVEYWPGREPDDWSTVGLAGWGYLSPQMGVIDGSMLGGIAVEVDDEQLEPGGYVRTPMIELSGADYEYVYRNGPYDGMLGLGDDGEVYRYDGLGGWFKRLRRRIRRGIRKIAGGIRRIRKRIRKGIRKVIRRLPGGKMLLKIGGKLRKIAMKIVKPLAKFGKKLAPIAAMIPGYGPAIAAGLRIGGKIAQHMGGASAGARRVKIRRVYGPAMPTPEAYGAVADYSRMIH